MKKRHVRHWTYATTGPALSLVLILFWAFNQNYLSQDKDPVALMLENPLVTFGLVIFGAFVSAYLCGDFDIKTPVTYEPLAYAFAGGVTMGCGAVMAAMSVHSVVLFNLAGIFNLTAFMITKGWIYAAFMALGGYAGSKVFRFLIRRTPHLKKEFFVLALRTQKTQKILFFVLSGLFILFLLAVVFFSVLTTYEKACFVFATFLLLLFGAIVERGTVCMSSMLKEWFLARSAYVWRSVLFTIMCLALLYQIGLKFSLYQPIQLEQRVGDIGLLAAGSFLMGAGFIFADGCFIGSLWKAGQGNIINSVGILGMLMGMGASQAGMKGFAGIRLLESSFPNYLSSLASPIFLLIFLWGTGSLLLVIFRQTRYRF